MVPVWDYGVTAAKAVDVGLGMRVLGTPAEALRCGGPRQDHLGEFAYVLVGVRG